MVNFRESKSLNMQIAGFKAGNSVVLYVVKRELLGLDDLATFVIAAIAAHAMRQLDLAALRAHRARGHSADIVGAATGMRTSTTGFLLRHCHGCHFSLSTPVNFQPECFKSINSDERG